MEIEDKFSTKPEVDINMVLSQIKAIQTDEIKEFVF